MYRGVAAGILPRAQGPIIMLVGQCPKPNVDLEDTVFGSVTGCALLAVADTRGLVARRVPGATAWEIISPGGGDKL
jgi:hypothetical protein